MVSVFDKKQSKGIIETAAKTLSSKEAAQEENENPNDYNIKMFNLGLETPVSLQDGQWYFVENLTTVSPIPGYSLVYGKAVLFNETSYAVYHIVGTSNSVGVLPYDKVMTVGIVDNVYEPRDYSGFFNNLSAGGIVVGKSKSFWSDPEKGTVTADAFKYQQLFGGGGYSFTYYFTDNNEWEFGPAPISWGTTIWDTLLGFGNNLA